MENKKTILTSENRKDTLQLTESAIKNFRRMWTAKKDIERLQGILEQKKALLGVLMRQFDLCNDRLRLMGYRDIDHASKELDSIGSVI